MTERELAEYASLRGTIRERGTVRICAFLAGLVSWALAALATAAIAIPLVALVPLLVLAGTFEAVFTIHVAVERVGRYLQVFYEDKWEETAMAFGRPTSGAATDPLFASFFALATACNFVPVLVAGPVPVELATLAGAHLLFGIRLAFARRAARRQRAVDLERFQQMKKGQPSRSINGAQAQS
ncbi:MAG TPA: hypothetical protein VM818_21895 [Vicinamibacterales bacterium]|nr:hypothetical protein [Vicinamibacterales bacterium]